jgi:hypothetical protein
VADLVSEVNPTKSPNPVYDLLFGRVVVKRDALKETDPDCLRRPLTSNALDEGGCPVLIRFNIFKTSY